MISQLFRCAGTSSYIHLLFLQYVSSIHIPFDLLKACDYLNNYSYGLPTSQQGYISHLQVPSENRDTCFLNYPGTNITKRTLTREAKWPQYPGYLYNMVAQKKLRTHYVKQVFSEKGIGFDDSFDVPKCLQQIEMPDLVHMCA